MEFLGKGPVSDIFASYLWLPADQFYQTIAENLQREHRLPLVAVVGGYGPNAYVGVATPSRLVGTESLLNAEREARDVTRYAPLRLGEHRRYNSRGSNAWVANNRRVQLPDVNVDVGLTRGNFAGETQVVYGYLPKPVEAKLIEQVGEKKLGRTVALSTESALRSEALRDAMVDVDTCLKLADQWRDPTSGLPIGTSPIIDAVTRTGSVPVTETVREGIGLVAFTSFGYPMSRHPEVTRQLAESAKTSLHDSELAGRVVLASKPNKDAAPVIVALVQGEGLDFEKKIVDLVATVKLSNDPDGDAAFPTAGSSTTHGMRIPVATSYEIVSRTSFPAEDLRSDLEEAVNRLTRDVQDTTSGAGARTGRWSTGEPIAKVFRRRRRGKPG